MPREATVPKSFQGTKEASRAEVLASTQQFFAAIDQRNMNVPTENQTAQISVQNRDDLEMLDVPITTVAVTNVTTTSPSITNVAVMDASSQRISLPEGSPPHPTVTTTLDLGSGCNNSQRDRLLNPKEKPPVQVNMKYH